jgi:polyferredoxin
LTIYIVVLLVLLTVLGILIFTRSDVQVTVLRARGALFQTMPDGQISNLYTVRILNKTAQELPVDLRLESPAGSLAVMGQGRLTVAPKKASENSVLIELPPATVHGTIPVVLGVYLNGQKLQTIKTSFVGPRS